MNIRTGFTDYEALGKYSPEFIEDVNLLITKVYSQWKLYEDLDEFSAFCWTKIVNSLKLYDETGGRERGSVSTYLFHVVWNEATRIFSKHKKMSNEEVENYSHMGSLWVVPTNSDDDLLLRDRVCSFARDAYDKNVYVDQRSLYKNYTSGHLTSAVKAFMWKFITSNQGLSV